MKRAAIITASLAVFCALALALPSILVAVASHQLKKLPQIQVGAMKAHWVWPPAMGLSIGSIRYGKVKFTQMTAIARLHGADVLLDDIAGKVLGSEVRGHARVHLPSPVGYTATFNIEHLNLKEVEDDFELKEKVRMRGLLGGRIDIAGQGPKVRVLGGALTASARGGRIILKDERLLKNMAQSQEALNIIVDSLKDYHYNTGNVTLSLEEGIVMLDAALDGETGKRNIKVALHDMLPK